jgi:predicted solute-binding protein
MDIEYDIKKVDESIKFYINTIGLSKDKATKLALEKYWQYFDKEKEIQDMKQELRKHYKIK